MPGHSATRLLTYAALAVAALSGRALSQSAPADSTWKDGPLRFWVSGGLGLSSFFENSGAAVRGAASVAYGRYVFTVRDMDGFDGIDGYYSTHETSALLGYRSSGRHLYRIIAIGFGNSTWKDGHGSCASVPCTFRDENPGFAYDVGFHATRMLGGVAVNVSGILGPKRTRLFGVTVSPQLGWFGR